MHFSVEPLSRYPGKLKLGKRDIKIAVPSPAGKEARREYADAGVIPGKSSTAGFAGARISSSSDTTSVATMDPRVEPEDPWQ
ncbi:MAG: hypothetical protein E6Q98_11815 [Rhodospirillaceae bacterium]|nr:MAG: hypothetical protein E6Q98_11815 [Rhodospirillaceae bacterium]